MNTALEAYTKVKLDDEVVHISELEKHQGGYSQPFKTGYDVFDNALMGGVRGGDLVILTGISGHGKTTMAQCISVNLSKRLLPSLWFSYEVIQSNLAAKFRAMGAQDESFLVYTPKRNTSGSLKWIQDKIKEGIEKFQTKFVFIDHIDYLSPLNTKNSDQRRIILRDICQELKSLAIDLEVVIFLIAHVKKVEGREVEMQDIAESSGIYQLADFVFSITRQKERRNVNGKMEETFENRSIIKILKNRLTGELPKIDVILENNFLCPLT